MEAVELLNRFNPAERNLGANTVNDNFILNILAVKEYWRMRCESNSGYMPQIFAAFGWIEKPVRENTLDFGRKTKFRFVNQKMRVIAIQKRSQKRGHESKSRTTERKIVAVNFDVLLRHRVVRNREANICNRSQKISYQSKENSTLVVGEFGYRLLEIEGRVVDVLCSILNLTDERLPPLRLAVLLRAVRSKHIKVCVSGRTQIGRILTMILYQLSKKV